MFYYKSAPNIAQSILMGCAFKHHPWHLSSPYSFLPRNRKWLISLMALGTGLGMCVAHPDPCALSPTLHHVVISEEEPTENRESLLLGEEAGKSLNLGCRIRKLHFAIPKPPFLFTWSFLFVYLFFSLSQLVQIWVGNQGESHTTRRSTL